MQWHDVYVSASAMALGAREDTATAVADGRYDQELNLAHGYQSVCVAADESVMDLAVQAAREALARSGVEPGDVRLVIHVSCNKQEPDGIAPASYIQGKTVTGLSSAIELCQASNGGIAAVEIASAYLAATPAGSSVLVTTSDKWHDRYRANAGYLVGDGGTGLVLSRGRGVARLLATVVIGDGRFSDVRGADESNYPSRRAFLAEQRRRMLPMLLAMSDFQKRSIELALADAGLQSAEISMWVFANIGHFGIVDKEFRKAFGIEDSMTTWDWGRTVGHLGAGDQIAGLTHLLETGAVRTGERIALCGSGAGFSYGCAILQLTSEPEWRHSHKLDS
jgi:3-oxoacyl-[acyl-carrier-protein] synthase III